MVGKSQEKLMYYSENNDSLVVRNSETRPDISSMPEIPVGTYGKGRVRFSSRFAFYDIIFFYIF